MALWNLVHLDPIKHLMDELQEKVMFNGLSGFFRCQIKGDEFGIF